MFEGEFIHGRDDFPKTISLPSQRKPWRRSSHRPSSICHARNCNTADDEQTTPDEGRSHLEGQEKTRRAIPPSRRRAASRVKETGEGWCRQDGHRHTSKPFHPDTLCNDGSMPRRDKHTESRVAQRMRGQASQRAVVLYCMPRNIVDTCAVSLTHKPSSRPRRCCRRARHSMLALTSEALRLLFHRNDETRVRGIFRQGQA